MSVTLRSPRLPSGGLRAAAVIAFALAIAACGPAGAASSRSAAPSESVAANPTAAPTGTITLYTSVQQPVVDPILAAFKVAQPGVTVELFRAPTGELSARMAAELRDGQIQGDILWLTDPLSMQAWASQDVLLAWAPANAAALDEADHTDTFWATRLINMVIVRGTDATPAAADWADLTDPGLKDAVALPDPAFAGSAFGALGYFGLAPEYGMDFYQDLHDNGAVQVKSPDEVTTGVAEGRFKAGITLDSSARAAVTKGSPVELAWPTSGAIAMYGPVAVVARSKNEAAARAFVEFLLSPDGQKVLGEAGQEPILPDSGGPEPGGKQVRPDWPAVFGQQQQLLEQYQAIVGG
jgi:iron(III) transport system substrate-binding protein